MSLKQEHHKRQEYCATRLRYRQGKELTAVKVYTAANECNHLLVFGVPKINLQQEVKRSFQRHGVLEFSKCVTEPIGQQVELELFTDVYHIKYQQLGQARRAKRALDAKQFYGGILHISYAPEYETTEELRQKLQQRKREVETRQRINTWEEKKLKTSVNSVHDLS